MSEGNPEKHLDDDEIIALIEELFDENAIGFIARQHWNGADWYECTCCGEEHRIKGDAIGPDHILTYEHKEDCNALKLYRMLQEEDLDVDAIITLFEEMINSEEIALPAYQRMDGADYYECPCCRKEHRIKGHAFGTLHISMGDHEDDCTLMKLYQALAERE